MDKAITTPEYRQLVHRLRLLREAAGLTQTQLAERIGESQKFVSAYERLLRRLDWYELRRIVEALGPPAAPLQKWFEAFDAMLDTLTAAIPAQRDE